MIMTSCTLEQRLARTYVGLNDPGEFYLLKPSYLFKFNLKEFEISGIDTLSEFKKDSLLLENSLLLKNITDSVFIDAFTNGLESKLKSFGANIIKEDDTDTLLNNGGTPYILNVAQISLEEYIHPYRSEEEIYDEIIVIDGIDLNAINYNVWIELGILNTETKNKVLFISDYLFDNLNGTLKQNLLTGKLSFDYTIDTINTEQVYQSARQFGDATAGYLFDYLMNAYIGENLPEDYRYERVYYHFDSERRILYPADEEQMMMELESY